VGEQDREGEEEVEDRDRLQTEEDYQPSLKLGIFGAVKSA